MSKSIRWAIIFVTMALFVHIYSTSNYYPIKLGVGVKSACNINDTFNCDAITSSSYSSFLGIPLSLWGATTHLALFLLLLTALFGLTEKVSSVLRFSLILSGFIAVMSLVMGAISAAVVGTYCVTCVASYILSFLSFEFIRRSQTKNSFSKDLSDIKKDGFKYFGLLIAIPLVSYVVNTSLLKNYEIGDLNKIVKQSVLRWQANIENDFSAQKPSLSYGPESAKMTIVEFADFLCGHCAQAAPSFDAFKKSHKDVRVLFYSFPLDGACNNLIGRSNEVGCRLAKATYCGGQQDQLGWKIHDNAFEKQKDFYSMGVSRVDKYLKSFTEKNSANWETLKTCMDSEETHETMQNQASLGNSSGVKGTPTIFVNGRKLPRGQLIPVLEAVYQKLNK